MVDALRGPPSAPAPCSARPTFLRREFPHDTRRRAINRQHAPAKPQRFQQEASNSALTRAGSPDPTGQRNACACHL